MANPHSKIVLFLHDGEREVKKIKGILILTSDPFKGFVQSTLQIADTIGD